MRKTVIVLVSAAALAFGLTGPAEATLITVDPDAFAEGTDISNLYPGVTLSAVGGGFGSGTGIFAVNPSTQPFEPTNASTGALTFGTDSSSFPHLFREFGFLHMRVDFASPTDFVSLDFIGNDSADVGEIRAFNSMGVQIGLVTTAVLGLGQVGTLTFSSAAKDIAWISAGGDSGVSSIAIDNLKFQVPEPAVLVLLGGLLVALGLARRRMS